MALVPRIKTLATIMKQIQMQTLRVVLGPEITSEEKVGIRLP
jgi:hypothetical protein